MVTKAKDRIRLGDGTLTTLGEALDDGLLEVVKVDYYEPPRYIAREVNGEFHWVIGKTLFLSRSGASLFGGPARPVKQSPPRALPVERAHSRMVDVDWLQEYLDSEIKRGDSVELDGEWYMVGKFVGDEVELWPAK